MKNTRYILFYALLVWLCGSCKSDQRLYLNSPDEESYVTKVNKTADWQVEHFKYSLEGSPGYLHDYGIDAWTNSTFLLGLTVWANSIEKQFPEEAKVYKEWLTQIGNLNEWRIPDNFKSYPKYSLYHADELCIAQFYLAMYHEYKDPKMIDETKERVDWIIKNSPDNKMVYHNKQSWTWCDALFMAPMVYVELYNLSADETYINFMHEEFLRTYHHLYNPQYKLFYRDSSYFNKVENNGKPVFWGRGNGWVAAALVNLLKNIPKDNFHYTFYLNLYQEFIPTLVNLMDEDGYWHASLLDPESYPSPETSASSLITYALAYGINENILERETYLPKLEKAWKTLQSFVDENGKLGWIQPIGANPKQVTKEMSSVYGVGAYLLAASEILKMKS